LRINNLFSVVTKGGGVGKKLLLRIITAIGKLLVPCDDVNTNLLLHDSETMATLSLSCFCIYSLHRRKAALAKLLIIKQACRGSSEEKKYLVRNVKKADATEVSVTGCVRPR
jgi:hypothetical protein